MTYKAQFRPLFSREGLKHREVREPGHRATSCKWWNGGFGSGHVAAELALETGLCNPWLCWWERPSLAEPFFCDFKRG